jgi:hypothetical protein
VPDPHQLFSVHVRELFFSFANSIVSLYVMLHCFRLLHLR